MRKLLTLVAGGILSLLATTAEATTYYVDDIGSSFDTRTCVEAQSPSTPRGTIAGGVACLDPGDTLLMRAGTYAETLGWTGWPGAGSLPNSWAEAITLSAFPGEVVTIRPNSGDFVVAMRGIAADSTTAPRYIIFNGIIFDAVNVASHAFYVNAYDGTIPTPNGSSHHIRLTSVEIKNASNGQGLLVVWGGDGVEIIDSSVHDIDHSSGQNTQCIYGGALDMLIDNVDIYNCWGYGISNINSNGAGAFNTNNHIIRNNRIYNNGFRDGAGGFGGLNLGEGTGNQVYNNVIYGNSGIGIEYNWGDGANGIKTWFNTVYGNGGGGIFIDTENINNEIRNNVAYNNTSFQLTNNGGGTTTASNNSTDGTNPQFTNAGAGDFTLAIGSPLIDAGITVAQVSTDHVGTSRSFGTAPDIGAYEFEDEEEQECDPSTTLPVVFTGTNGVAIAVYNCNFSIIQGSFSLSSNTLTDIGGGFSVAAWNGGPTTVGTPNQYAQFDVSALAAGMYMGVAIRGQAGTNAGYHLTVDSNMAFLEYHNSGATTLGTHGTVQVGDEWRVEIIGTALKVYRNDIEVITATHSDLAVGIPFVVSYGNDGSTRIDNFTTDGVPDVPVPESPTYRYRFVKWLNAFSRYF
jgi:hypothetical protein